MDIVIRSFDIVLDSAKNHNLRLVLYRSDKKTTSFDIPSWQIGVFLKGNKVTSVTELVGKKVDVSRETLQWKSMELH